MYGELSPYLHLYRLIFSLARSTVEIIERITRTMFQMYGDHSFIHLP